MITSNLRTNQLSETATDWYIHQYLAAMDALDVQRYAEFLVENVSLQFNNGPPVIGKPEVIGMLGAYWKSFASIEHDLINIYGQDDRFMLEAMNHYLRHDGRRVTVQAVALTDRNDKGQVSSVRVYADASPVFAP